MHRFKIQQFRPTFYILTLEYKVAVSTIMFHNVAKVKGSICTYRGYKF